MKNFFAIFIAILCMVAITGVFISVAKKDEQTLIVVAANDNSLDESPDKPPPKEPYSKCTNPNNENSALNNYLSILYGKILDVPIFYICEIFKDSNNKTKKKNGKRKKKKK